MGSESDERPTKKRARNSTTAAEPASKGKKQRGRPKVDTQDETAADRRRTQIRLAQRAYRQRKEMTISSLQKQVEQLQSVIDGMNDSFLRFNDSAMASDIFSLRPQLASELKETTEQFVSLARSAKTVGSEDEREDSQEAAESNTTPPANTATPDISSRNYQDLSQPRHDAMPPPPANDAQADMPSQATHIGLGYYKIADESDAMGYGQNVDFYSGFELPSLSSSSLDASREAMFTEQQQPQSTPYTSFPFRGPHQVDPGNPSVNLFQARDFAENEDENNRSTALTATRGGSSALVTQISTFIPSPKYTTIQPTFTYSFQETTFARRLQRACLERAFHLLSTAHLRPSDFNRVFRLCRHYSSRDELLKAFRDLLQNSILQPLDFLKSPFLHLGGAGTHYPARDDTGRVIPSQADWNVRRIGPWATKAQIQANRTRARPDIAVTAQLEEDLVAYGGEWFDSQDVEGYLEELGVHIDAQASFAEATVRTLDALARAQSPQGDGVHPDSEMGVLGEALDQFAPNHLSTFMVSSPPQQQQAGSPQSTSVPGSNSIPGTIGDSSGSHIGRTNSIGPSTPDSASILQQAAQQLDRGCPMGLGEFQPVDPKAYDEWDRFYDLDLAWLGNNQANPSDIFGNDVASVPQVEERRAARTVTIDVQRFINGLIKRGVCIGRGPGFRRADVNYALRAAVIEAF